MDIKNKMNYKTFNALKRDDYRFYLFFMKQTNNKCSFTYTTFKNHIEALKKILKNEK